VTSKPTRDFAQDITNIILAKLEQGVLPWKRPWAKRNERPLRHNGEPYSGINYFYLSTVSDANGYQSPFWMTYKQATDLGAQVRKGEQGSFSVYYARSVKHDINSATGQEETRAFSFLKYYYVFNADQIDGLPPYYHPEPPAPRNPHELQQEASNFLESVPLHVVHRGDEAYYAPSTDTITLPPPEAFHTIEDYFSTRVHETIHATGAKHRLNRQFGKRFGDQAYAYEELVACMGEAKLCAQFDLPIELHDNHAAYLAHWLKVLKSDKMAIIQAATKADQAIRWLTENSTAQLAQAA
jgi:antirestriction protein ArdC